jgi:5-methylcytosine-specific restriction enzyme A
MSEPATPGPPARIVRDSRRWFTEGRALKAAARRSQRCVECHRPLADRRTPYCSARCQWGFRGHYFWDAARSYVFRRDRFTCQICRRRYRVRFLEVDHIVEIARGGAPLDYLNLQTVCRSCHRRKTVEFLRARPRGAAPTLPPGGPEGEWGAAWFPA